MSYAGRDLRDAFEQLDEGLISFGEFLFKLSEWQMKREIEDFNNLKEVQERVEQS